jgi:hypothetical protein
MSYPQLSVSAKASLAGTPSFVEGTGGEPAKPKGPDMVVNPGTRHNNPQASRVRMTQALAPDPVAPPAPVTPVEPVTPAMPAPVTPVEPTTPPVEPVTPVEPTTPPVETPPDGAVTVPEKFLRDGVPDVQAMADSIKELETKLRNGGKEPTAPTDLGPVLGQEAMQRYGDSISTSGKLSEDQVAALAAAGVPAELVEMAVNGAVERGRRVEEATHAIFGGAENFKEVTAWFAANATAGEIQSINSMWSTGDAEVSATAARAVLAKYQEANGTKATHSVTGAPAGIAQGVQPFANMSEYTEACKKPEYKTSANYRASVQRRLQVSRSQGRL